MIITKIKKKLQAKLYEAKMFCNTEEYCTAELQVEIQILDNIRYIFSNNSL